MKDEAADRKRTWWWGVGSWWGGSLNLSFPLENRAKTVANPSIAENEIRIQSDFTVIFLLFSSTETLRDIVLCLNKTGFWRHFMAY